jgi:hypothetical protein
VGHDLEDVVGRWERSIHLGGHEAGPSHFADRCTDPEAKARNDAFLASRRDEPNTEEHKDQA